MAMAKGIFLRNIPKLILCLKVIEQEFVYITLSKNLLPLLLEKTLGSIHVSEAPGKTLTPKGIGTKSVVCP